MLHSLIFVFQTGICAIELKNMWPLNRSLTVLQVLSVLDLRVHSLSGGHWVLFKQLRLHDVYFCCCCWNSSPLPPFCFRVAAWIHPIKAWLCSWWPLDNRTSLRFCSDPSRHTRKSPSLNSTRIKLRLRCTSLFFYLSNLGKWPYSKVIVPLWRMTCWTNKHIKTGK